MGTSTGRILNSRSEAEVYASRSAGGIAGEISGQTEAGHGISNSCARGSVSSESTAGGITGKAASNVRIENTYFAGSFKKSPAGVDALWQGSIVGEHQTEILKNCYFLDSTAPADGQAQHIPGMESVTEETMRSRSFADTLNEGVTEPEYDYWVQNTGQGNGYLCQTQNPYEEQAITDPATGITLSGKIHMAAKTDIRQLTPEDEDYRMLQDYVNGQKLNQVYYIGFVISGRDRGGSAFEDSVALSFPLAAEAKDSEPWMVHYNGEKLQVYKNIQIKDGRLEVSVEALHTFGIVSRADTPKPDPEDSGDHGTDTPKPGPDDSDDHGTDTPESDSEDLGNRGANTGDSTDIFLWICLAALSALTAAVTIIRRVKGRGM